MALLGTNPGRLWSMIKRNRLARTLRAFPPINTLFLFWRTIRSTLTVRATRRQAARDLAQLFARHCEQIRPANTNSADPRFVISVTTHGTRTNSLAPIAIASLMSQTVSADKVVLWLSPSEDIGRELRRLVSLGLEIRRCHDLGPHTKLLPALHDFPSACIITADDDAIYPSDWLSGFIDAHRLTPKKIVCGRAHEIRISDGQLLPYSRWVYEVRSPSNAAMLFPTGIGGILYPPDSLDARASDEALFRQLAPNNDDIWFWAMAHLRGTEYALLAEYPKAADLLINKADDDGLGVAGNRYGGNDVQLAKTVSYFPNLRNDLGLFAPTYLGKSAGGVSATG